MFKIIFQKKFGFNALPNELNAMFTNYKFCDDLVMYGEFSKTNVFIGENNSGKSRFLRALFSSKYDEMSPEDFENFQTEMSGEISGRGLKCVNDFYKSMDVQNYHSYDVSVFWSTLEKNCKPSDDVQRYYFPALRGIKDYKTTIEKKLNSFLLSVCDSIKSQDSVHHFINLLKLDSSGLNKFDIYREIITQEYFMSGSTSAKHILTGGSLYQEIKACLLGDKWQRELVVEFQEFLHKHFFPEYKDIQLIPKESKGVLCVKIGDDEREIYNWGDGTQQLITMLFPIFKCKDEGATFFVEEPELYLHPGLLRKIIEVINLDIFEKHQYFMTTHSNMVLDASADANINMSIFKFKKMKEQSDDRQEKFTVEQCNNGDTSLLNELGVRNSSVFLSNCSIWVEGITDRLYLKHYLKLYVDKFPESKCFRENLDYTFIEYGGGNLVHFNFAQDISSEAINAKYINNKIFLIADNDNTPRNSKKAERKDYLKKVLGDNFYELSVMEIENLITQETLKKILISQNRDKEGIICQKLNKDRKFQHQKLGKFIDGVFNGELRKYASASGTINNKLEFCKKAIEVTTDYDQLSFEAKALTEKIYDFIEQNSQI